jgi:NitT/TauT family transport system ATP-binding protein
MTDTHTEPTTPASAATADGAVLLAAEHVMKYFGEGARRILVLNDVDVSVRDGEILAIMGPSGSGKSTLLRILAGLASPSEGVVRFRGEVQQGAVNPHIAIVFQTFALFPWLTVYQNVEVGLLNSDVPETQRRRRILEAIDLIGLDGFEDAYPKELSGGMRQRVGFARALVVQPEVLFMDEPFSALDVLTAENLKRELVGLWRSRKIPTRAIVLVTHNIEEAVLMGDRLVVMGSHPGVVRVDMPGLPFEERVKAHPEQTRLVDYIYEVMTNPGEAVAPFRAGAPEARPIRPQQPTRSYQVLPHVPVGQVTGLVERLHSDGDRAEIYALGRELHLEVDDLLPLIQAIDLLGMGDVDGGEVYLTPPGVQFAVMGVLEEKEVFRSQALQHIQLIKNIMACLERVPNGVVKYETVLRTLDDRFSPAEAERQLDTAIDWGRYAELFSYDDVDRVFARDPGDGVAKPYTPSRS